MKKMIILALICAIIMMVSVSMAEGTPFVCVVRKGEWVWVRSGPSKDSDKVDTIRYGVGGVIHEIQNGYARITSTYGKEGWVDVYYLEMPIEEETWVITTEDPLNKRETPGGRYLARIKGGSRISVLGWRYDKNGELWAKVYHGGYVMAKYLAKAE